MAYYPLESEIRNGKEEGWLYTAGEVEILLDVMMVLTAIGVSACWIYSLIFCTSCKDIGKQS
jgi:hypothetical protein